MNESNLNIGGYMFHPSSTPLLFTSHLLTVMLLLFFFIVTPEHNFFFNFTDEFFIKTL